MTRPMQALGGLALAGLAVCLPWLTAWSAALWLSSSRAILETPLTALAVAAFVLVVKIIALMKNQSLLVYTQHCVNSSFPGVFCLSLFN